MVLLLGMSSVTMMRWRGGAVANAPLLSCGAREGVARGNNKPIDDKLTNDIQEEICQAHGDTRDQRRPAGAGVVRGTAAPPSPNPPAVVAAATAAIECCLYRPPLSQLLSITTVKRQCPPSSIAAVKR